MDASRYSDHYQALPERLVAKVISAEGANPPGIAQAKGRQGTSKLWREMAR
jgi:hypothetical protein